MAEPPVRPQLSVVIVTWNCAELLAQCLASLRRCAGVLDFELLVVDNASADQTLAVVARDWPGATVIANTRNTGFAFASNQGMAAARAELVFLLNPDTLLTQPATLQRLCERLAAHPEIAMAGLRLVFPDGRYQVGDAGHSPSLAAVVSHAFLLSRLSQRLFPALMLQEGSVAPPYGRVGWVCGGCTVVRRSALAQAGMLDESFFLYGEDIEWGCRFTQAGLLVAYLPDIEIVHVQGGTQKSADPLARPPTRWIDGMARLFHRHNRGRHFWAFRLALASGFLLRGLVYRAREWLRPPAPDTPRRSLAMFTYAGHVWRQRVPTTELHPS